MTTDCGTWIGKYLLCIFNFIFFVIGTIVLGIGVWLSIDKSSFIALLKLVEMKHINEYEMNLEYFIKSANLQLLSSDFTQPQVIEQMAYVLIVIGAVMFILSFLGYCGAIRESRCLLMTYGIFLILLFIGELVAGGLAAFYKENVRNETKNFLETTITKYYTPNSHPDAVTHMWNQIMSSFACCGVNDYRDFETSTYWMANKGNNTLPEACCILKDVKNYIPRDDDCVTNPNETNSFYKTGCYNAMVDWIISHREIIIGVLVGVGIIHLFAIFLAFSLYKSFAKYHGMRL